jgi:hypothetical protein
MSTDAPNRSGENEIPGQDDTEGHRVARSQPTPEEDTEGHSFRGI